MGPEEEPFGLQLDFLCARSAYYRQFFFENQHEQSIERIVRIPDTMPEMFGYVQNYMFTGQVFPNLDHMPSYEVLIGVWKLGHNLIVEGLCDATLEAMAECRRTTQRIPATPLLVQVWQDTPEGSSIRKLLLSWAAEYMRSSESRAEFARSLPQEVLSELVVAMSSLDSPPLVQVNHQGSVVAAQPQPRAGAVHYIAADDDGAELGPASKKQRRQTDVLPRPSAPVVAKNAASKKPGPRTSLPNPKGQVRRRAGAASSNPANHTTAQKLNFCNDLLTRMLSGPGKKSQPRLSLRGKGTDIFTSRRILDAPRRAVQRTRRSGAGRGARLLRQGQQADGPRHHEGQDGPRGVRGRGGVPQGHEPDLLQLLHVLEQEGPDVGRVREAPEEF